MVPVPLPSSEPFAIGRTPGRVGPRNRRPATQQATHPARFVSHTPVEVVEQFLPQLRTPLKGLDLLFRPRPRGNRIGRCGCMVEVRNAPPSELARDRVHLSHTRSVEAAIAETTRAIDLRMPAISARLHRVSSVTISPAITLTATVTTAGKPWCRMIVTGVRRDGKAFTFDSSGRRLLVQSSSGSQAHIFRCRIIRIAFGSTLYFLAVARTPSDPWRMASTSSRVSLCLPCRSPIADRPRSTRSFTLSA